MELEDLIGHVERPDVAGAGVGFGDFGEDVRWSNDGEGGQLGELREDLEPPWWVIVAAWTGEVGDDGFYVDVEVVGCEEEEDGFEV